MRIAQKALFTDVVQPPQGVVARWEIASSVRLWTRPIPAQKAQPAASKVSGLLQLLVIGGLGWYFAQINYGSKRTNETIAATFRAPITLLDEVENLTASSLKAVRLDVPYDGLLAADVRILRGNPVDIYLLTADQADLISKADWKNVRVNSDFNAAKTTTFRRSGRVSKSLYYLILRDTSLGILSAQTTDINVKINLNP
jgi:hypothetical protein